ncbi:MAG: ethanolamine utilization protein EutA [Alphaproteobacteria bacterium]|jgi:ethanolamine utilization protein EutA
MHDDDGSHDHDFERGMPDDEGEELEGIERFTLRSVGIDIGSSTTHSIFSKLTLRREGAGLSAKFVVTGREVIYRSPIMLTPYLSDTQIDTDQVTSFVESAYAEAGFMPGDIDTGAVVITGEALKKENAQPILEHFSREGGRFICASAGPMHEALLAAYGSGAVAMSQHHDNAVLDMDIGGGTTKISVVRSGRIAQMVAVEIGARLIAYDKNMRITRVERPARTIMKALGHKVEVGGKLTPTQREAFAQRMTDVLFDVISGRPQDPLTDQLMLTGGLKDVAPASIDHLVFSGGVSEYIYARDTVEYGDIGPWLGKAIRDRTQSTFKPGVLVQPVEGIRATVIGAGEYTLQASGSTSYISTTTALPVRGVQVAHALITKEQSPGEIHAALIAALGKYDRTHLNGQIVLALSAAGQPDYPYIRRLAEGIVQILDPNGPTGEPLFVMLDVDMAKSLGSILREELQVDRPVIVVDGIEVGDLDYVDMGRPIGTSEVIPVTVKSLVFAMRSKSG